MTSGETGFAEMESVLADGGVEAALERLVDELRRRGQYAELFEALKMRLRHGLGLPLLHDDGADRLDDATRERLEAGLLDACRQVGGLLFESGAAREGWMYWRPLGERQAAAEALARIEADEDNLDELIEVLLREGVDPARGYRLVLEHFGTCNAITTLEGEVYQRTPEELRELIALLLDHVRQELVESVRADIERREGRAPEEGSLKELVADRDGMFGEYSYHIDTTHLASTVRFARRLEDPRHLRAALDLTEYGRRLDPQFQYPDDEPFADFYSGHARYFRVLLDEDADEALEFFREKAETVDQDRYGTLAVETYIDLLARRGRFEEAIEQALTRIGPDARTLGIAPSLFELSRGAGSFDRFLDLCRRRGDLLGYATGLLHCR